MPARGQALAARAPRSRSQSVSASAPAEVAASSGVWSSQPTQLMSAPRSSKRAAIACWPAQQAPQNAFVTSSASGPGSALSSSRTRSVRPSEDAWYRFGWAPRSTRRRPPRPTGPRIAAIATERPDLTHVLLIDELNRANVPKVLGELLFLLEYRDEEIRLQYSDAEFSLPANLRIIATMNTADRSVALIDTALRRRFHFVPFFPDTPPINLLLRRWLKDKQPDLVWVADVVDRANLALADRNAAIGPSHFLKPQLTEDLVCLAWENSVLPFLEEHFFADPDQLKRFDLDWLRNGAPKPIADAAEAPSSSAEA